MEAGGGRGGGADYLYELGASANYNTNVDVGQNVDMIDRCVCAHHALLSLPSLWWCRQFGGAISLVVTVACVPCGQPLNMGAAAQPSLSPWRQNVRAA